MSIKWLVKEQRRDLWVKRRGKWKLMKKGEGQGEEEEEKIAIEVAEGHVF